MLWTKNKRSSGITEWVCLHGVGHPTKTSAEEVAKKHGHKVDIWMVHGCCGCCKRDDFPDR
jgi:hypothetical protein